MYQYTDFDKQFVQLRAAQYRDQLERWQAGKLSEDEFKPLRLQNGWYIQRYAPMLRVAHSVDAAEKVAALLEMALPGLPVAAPEAVVQGEAVKVPEAVLLSVPAA